MSDFRVEKDFIGEVKIPKDKHYGINTQRSLVNFKIGNTVDGNKMPKEIIEAFIIIKKVAAQTNEELGELDEQKASAIINACDHILADLNTFYENDFPLVIWQTGSGTQTNMNVNEVIASVANEKLTGKRGAKTPISPNDHVNMGQSSNDTFPTAMHLAVCIASAKKLCPALCMLKKALKSKSVDFEDIIKVGRTHLQDAIPMTLGQEFSGFFQQTENSVERIAASLKNVCMLAQGGTAVGTGLNANAGFAWHFAHNMNQIVKLSDIFSEAFAASLGYKIKPELSQDAHLNPNLKKQFVKDETHKEYNRDANGIVVDEDKMIGDEEMIDIELLSKADCVLHKFETAPNKFEAIASHDAMVEFAGTLNTVSVSLIKIANDIRLLSSGPRCMIGEITLPANEAGSSIMPAKVNPTQCEALAMVSCQVMGNCNTVSIAVSHGHLQLNTFKPVIAQNVIQSINLMSDAVNSFVKNCVNGIKANESRASSFVEQSLMVATALTKTLGYETVADVVKKAIKTGKTVKEIVVEDKLMTAKECDKAMSPKNLV